MMMVIEQRNRKLVDFVIDESDTALGIFADKIELSLVGFILPPCKLKPVYEV